MLRSIPTLLRSVTNLRQSEPSVPGSLKHGLGQVRTWRDVERGRRFAEGWSSRDGAAAPDPPGAAIDKSPLRSLVEGRISGRGIHKWAHYLDVYERHLGRFVGTDVHLLEIGVQSGGSIEMWRQWLGERSTIYGVDIDPRAARSEGEGVRVFIGDQADRRFWRQLRMEARRIDVVVDDGGHSPEQQRVTLEELLPHLSPGGVYICEDVHGQSNRFLAYIHGLSRAFCAGRGYERASDSVPWGEMVSAATPFQAALDSIHLYPFLVAFETRRASPVEFVAPRLGDDFLTY